MNLNKRYDGSEADTVGAAIFAQFPGLLNRTSEVFSRLFSIARTYTLSQKYDITQRTFASITHLLIEYLKLRNNNLVMPTATQTMVFGAAQVRLDWVLTRQLDEFLAIYKLAASRKDEEICRQIIECHRAIAIASIDIDPIATHPGENPTTTYILLSVGSLATLAGTHGLDDSCLTACRALSDIGASVVHRNLYLNFTSAVDAIGTVAMLGVLRSRQVLTGEAVSAIGRMVVSLLSNEFMVRNSYRHSVRLLEEISKAQLQALGKAQGIDFSVRNTLGPFLEVTSRTGLARWFEISTNYTLDALQKTDKDAEAAMSVFAELSDQLWLHLANIGEAAAPAESFALFFVDTNIREIGRMQIMVYLQVREKLASRPEMNDRESAMATRHYDHFARELLREIDALISAIYWRIYKALPSPARSTLVWNFFDTLQELGITAIEADLGEEATGAIMHLASLVTAMLEKPLESPYSPGRVAAHIARVGMVALHRNDEGVVNSSLQALRKLQAQFVTKFAGNEELESSLLREVDEIAADLDHGAPSLDEVEIHFSRSVTSEDVTVYIKQLHEMLHLG